MTLFEKKFGKDYLKGVVLTPGTYAFYGINDQILYVGKAKNLRRRLSQYKNSKRLRKHRKMRKIVTHAVRLEWTQSATHLDACVEEVKLIQKHRPQFNIEAKYSFLYPMIGLEEKKDTVVFCLTTHPENFPSFQFFGSFRSRRLSGNAFFSLYRVLKFLYHPASKKSTEKPKGVKHSYLLGLRKLPPPKLEKIKQFLKGDSRELLEDITWKLLEKKAARVLSWSVQEDLDHLARFFRYEAKPLNNVLQKISWEIYPIPQIERDLVFLRSRIHD